MKNAIKNIFIAVVTAFVAFAFAPTTEKVKPIKIKKSTITWKGYKVTGHHEGGIQIKSGSLTFNEEKLTGGEFTIDMTTINCTDLKGKYKEKFENHLRSDDFFGVDQYPTANIVFTNVQPKSKNSYTVTGDLTIKGKTSPITFEFSVYGSKATAALKIDRTKYDVKYGSASFFDDLKNRVIYDEFDLNASLEF